MASHLFYLFNRLHLCVTASVRQQAEQIKKDLSSSAIVTFSCVMPSKDKSSDVRLATQPWDKGGHLVEFVMTVDDFHNVCRDLFQRSMIPVHRLLQDQGEVTCLLVYDWHNYDSPNSECSSCPFARHGLNVARVLRHVVINRFLQEQYMTPVGVESIES